MLLVSAAPLALTLLLALAARAAAAAQEPLIDTLALRAHTYFLAHDALAGRGTGTAGERIAAEYIAALCLRLGLGPVGGDFLHPLPLEGARVLERTHLTVKTPLGTTHYRYPDDVTPNVGTRATLIGYSGRAVWVGEDAEITGGLGGLSLAGAVAVTAGTVSPAASDTLAARGAVGMVHLTPDQDAFEHYRKSRGATRLYHRSAAVASSLLPRLPSVVAAPSVGHQLLAALRARAGTPPAPRELGAQVAFGITLDVREVSAHNVACLLPGADAAARDSAIAFTAHYDHLGIGFPDSGGDAIYNGFSDNAAGVAMLLAIADAFRPAAVRPRHSLLFLFFSGEEQGLLGSDYYVHAPPWPLERVRAVINLDAGAPAAPPRTWRLAGVDSTGLGALAIAVAAARGWSVTTSPPRPNSDYYPFVRRGVPAVFIIPGPGAYEGLTHDASDALRRRWDRYHRPDDEWTPAFPFSGLQRYAEFAYRLAQAVDTAAVAR